MVWQKNGTPDTLGAPADVLTISNLESLQFNQFLCHILRDGNAQVFQTFNSDTGSNYTQRRSANGGADTTVTNQNNFDTHQGQAGEDFIVQYSMWVSGEEKLQLGHYMQSSATGAGTAPDRREFAQKYVPSPLTDTCDRTDFTNASGGGDYDTDSNLSSLGTN